VAVAGVGIEGDVGDNADARHGGLDGPQRAAHQVFGILRFAAGSIAQVRVGVGKQGEGRDAQTRRLFGRAHRLVHAETLHAGHGGHRFAYLFALAHENRPDQIVHRQRVLAHQPPAPVALAVAAQAMGNLKSAFETLDIAGRRGAEACVAHGHGSARIGGDPRDPAGCHLIDPCLPRCEPCGAFRQSLVPFQAEGAC